MKQAQQQLQISLGLFREIEDQPGIAACQKALAEVANAMGEDEAAQQYRAET